MCKSDSRVFELESKIKDGSKCFEDYTSLGLIYFDREDFYEYLVLLDKVLVLSLINIERAITLSDKGEALELLGKRIEAHPCFEQSLNLLTNEEETPDILYIKGKNHLKLTLSYFNDERECEHINQAIEKFKVLLEKELDYEVKHKATSYLAESYCRNNEFDKAVEYYKKAVKISNNDDDKVWSLHGIATVYRERADYKKSEEAFKQALDIADDKKYYSKLYFDMGEMYFNSDHKRDAFDAFNNALNYKEYAQYFKDNNVYIAEIYWYLGSLVYNSIYDHNDGFDKVIGFLRKTLEDINEDHGYYYDSHITLGHCYLAKGDYDKAKEHYDIVKAATSVTEEQKDMVSKCLKEIETRGKVSGIGSFISKILKKKK